MNPRLATLQPYPFEKLRALLAGVTPNPAFKPINLSIGEPKHPTPALVKDALTGALEGLASYPATAGTPALREAIADWLVRRYALDAVDPATQVLPINGSREALFAFAQTVVDATRPGARVVCPNPFYQIYEGAALLAGAEPLYLNATPENGYRVDYAALPDAAWRDVQLVYACSPANPSGSVMTLDDWRRLFELSDRHGFVIASDECYSELYFDEARPPLGALQAAQRLGRKGFPRLVVFSSLSKRSNAPGMRSGFVAGDAALLKSFLLYRTYHGSAMSLPVQQASIAAWRDEAHVRDNRRLYAEKFAAVLPMIEAPLSAYMPEGGFYLWMRTPIDDCDFARRLQHEYNVLVLPGSYLAREAHGRNPGRNYVRIALVASREECVEAVARIRQFARTL
jgi:N-succinyldiaminopimelate aminotransferase